MIYKHLPKDFEVNELYNLEEIIKEDEGHGKIYYYFILEKTNYTQLKALEKVANIFKVRRDDIHFAGTKDRVGITRQLISVKGIKKHTFENNIKFFNQRLGPDLKLTFIDRFNSRISLGDNMGNKFIITLRDLDEEEINIIKQTIPIIEKEGVLNYFDEQRFGYAGNSHIIGKYVLQNNLELAVKEILTSLPPNPREDFLNFSDKIKENWEEIKNQNQKLISTIIKSAPKFYKNECRMLRHLHDHKNDFPGSFRIIHKKLRTLYINAYQSYLFNEVLASYEKMQERNKSEVSGILFDNALNKFQSLETPDTLELMHESLDLSTSYGKTYAQLIEKDSLSQDSFTLQSSPELLQEKTSRKVKIYPRNIKIHAKSKDDEFEGKKKLILSFELEKGAYATNVIKQLLKQNL
ncbi:MAG: tRNA pseudouridine(13) synthase TruD [Nanoarchaeota archaeon]|nr:tRNA pseudouridine(13) synthase TruD [Nanoarchaeota archaeon]